jgi:hypothetical protein
MEAKRLAKTRDVREFRFFYVTEDRDDGALQRFTPDDPDWNDP